MNDDLFPAEELEGTETAVETPVVVAPAPAPVAPALTKEDLAAGFTEAFKNIQQASIVDERTPDKLREMAEQAFEYADTKTGMALLREADKKERKAELAEVRQEFAQQTHAIISSQRMQQDMVGKVSSNAQTHLQATLSKFNPAALQQLSNTAEGQELLQQFQDAAEFRAMKENARAGVPFTSNQGGVNRAGPMISDSVVQKFINGTGMSIEEGRSALSGIEGFNPNTLLGN